jgi:hypothetical protein
MSRSSVRLASDSPDCKPVCRTVLKSVLPQLWCNPECVNRRRFSRRRSFDKRWPGRPLRACPIAAMISLVRLVCWSVVHMGRKTLERRSLKIHRSQPSMPATPATGVQQKDHRNALDGKVLQKTPVLAMAQAQTCHRFRNCTKVASEPINRGRATCYQFCQGEPSCFM